MYVPGLTLTTVRLRELSRTTTLDAMTLEGDGHRRSGLCGYLIAILNRFLMEVYYGSTQYLVCR